MEQDAFPKSWKRALCTLMVVAGLAMYLYWGLTYGAWNFLAPEYVGIYGLMLALIGIGAAGLLLMRWENED